MRTVGASACVIFTLLQKIQKMTNKDMTFGYHAVGTPHSYANRKWRNPAGMQHNPRVQGCVNFHLRADGLQKGWDSGSGPGMLTD